jgi:small subunit ribosomal protein S9
VTVNKTDAANYFPTAVLQYKLNQPFSITETEGQYDVNVNVYGGGINGQADAVRLAMSKALVEINPEWKPSLKEVGLMTRDPRIEEGSEARAVLQALIRIPKYFQVAAL